MSRPLRPDFAGAVHHITSRGHRRKAIFKTDRDRRKFLELLGEAAQRYGWLISAYVLMTNHYHFVLETPIANLSDGMQWLNSSYAGWYNAKHKRQNSLFGDRFHSFLIEKDRYFQEVCRYVVLNPVRAKMVERPEDYKWSSYNATAGLCAPPEWLNVESLQPFFGSEDAWQKNYIDYVAEKIGSEERIWTKVKRRIFLGSSAWVASMRSMVESKMVTDVHPREQRTVGRPTMAGVIAAIAKTFEIRMSDIRHGRGGAARMAAAFIGWHEGLLRLRQIGAALRLRSQGRVSDLVRECERELKKDPLLQQLIIATLRALPS